MIPLATDEDIALRASSDVMALCPRDQTLVSGSDGVIAPDDRWTLASPGANLAGVGLQPGQLIHLIRPTSAFGPGGEVLVIHQVTPTGVVLRRKGQLAGVGQPPAAATGIEFAVRTLGPQIVRAGQEIGRRLGIDDRFPGRRAIDLGDPTEVREAVVLTVLYRQFLDQSRQSSGAGDRPDDWYSAKARMIKAELDERLSGLALRWSSNANGAGETIRFGMRMTR
ncbi:hypothetical protein TA3x_002281 [Tundrisphaera sp. TA3]|uniref:hypothetical protein n=1 Tax=Tundrisphaera sp. TA3 TaxID=3435775 RepID=UPI003EBB8D3D